MIWFPAFAGMRSRASGDPFSEDGHFGTLRVAEMTLPVIDGVLDRGLRVNEWDSGAFEGQSAA